MCITATNSITPTTPWARLARTASCPTNTRCGFWISDYLVVGDEVTRLGDQEIQNSKLEMRSKLEIPNSNTPKSLNLPRGINRLFEFRASNLFRISDFEFRIFRGTVRYVVSYNRHL